MLWEPKTSSDDAEALPDSINQVPSCCVAMCVEHIHPSKPRLQSQSTLQLKRLGIVVCNNLIC